MMNENYEIMIVDSLSENIIMAKRILHNDKYNFTEALSAKEAIEFLKHKRFDLILLDAYLPDIDGFHLSKIIKNTPAIKDTPIFFLTDKDDADSIEEGFNVGAIDYVTKPFYPAVLQSRVENHLEHYRYKRVLEYNNIFLNKEIKSAKIQQNSYLKQAQKEIMYILTEIISSDSDEEACHIKRVTKIAKELAILEGHLTTSEVETISHASPLYSIGKSLIKSNVLQKKTKLTPQELEEIHQYPALAENILKKSKNELLKAVRIIASQHHENYDGTGYARGLKGEEIHIFGRLVAIADVIDSITHDRAYEKAWSFEKSVKYVVGLSGTKFDPRLVDLFSDNLEVFKEIIEDYPCQS